MSVPPSSGLYTNSPPAAHKALAHERAGAVDSFRADHGRGREAAGRRAPGPSASPPSLHHLSVAKEAREGGRSQIRTAAAPMTARVLVTGAGTGACENLLRSLRAGDASLAIVGCHHDRFALKGSTADAK